MVLFWPKRWASTQKSAGQPQEGFWGQAGAALLKYDLQTHWYWAGRRSKHWGHIFRNLCSSSIFLVLFKSIICKTEQLILLYQEPENHWSRGEWLCQVEKHCQQLPEGEVRDIRGTDQRAEWVMGHRKGGLRKHPRAECQKWMDPEPSLLHAVRPKTLYLRFYYTCIHIQQSAWRWNWVSYKLQNLKIAFKSINRQPQRARGTVALYQPSGK